VKQLSNTLNDVAGYIGRYVVLTDHQRDTTALWVAHTYVIDAFETTPYLAVTSPEKRSGKSRFLDVIQGIVAKPWRELLPSEAVVYRKIEKDQPTLLLDEVDAIWGPKAREHEGLRALLNAGYRKQGSHVPRCVGNSFEVKDFSTFCAKALAGIGELPDTIADRSIPIRMKRKRRSDRVDRFRARDVAQVSADLRDAITSAVCPHIEALMEARPSLPDELDDRAQDAWEALFAIADLAGGDWPSRARTAALTLSAGRDAADDGAGHRLLVDCRTVFEETGADDLLTSVLIEHLVAIPDAPWGDWYGKPITGRRVAGLLRPYEIGPHRPSAGSTYRKADFIDAWARYAPQSATSATDGVVEPKTADFKVPQEPSYGTSENGDSSIWERDRGTYGTSNAEIGAEPLSAAEEAELERLMERHSDIAGEGRP